MNTDLNADALVESAYQVHAGPLLRRLTASTRDAAAAEDLTQEAFVRLVIEVRAGHVPDDIGAWLHRVGQNLATSRGRRIAVARRRNGELMRPDSTPSPELLTVEAEAHSSLRAALSELGPADRHALILAAEGYRGPEIARSMGRTDAATRTLLCRARTKLRGLMIQAGVT
jgi:RNA polymerase sigma-70 factor (ECF subfamily)